MTDSALRDAAVNAALSQNWEQAIIVNKQILLNSPKNIEALNRLGYAFLKTGKVILSKQMFEKVLKIDPYNRIAQNNIQKITALKKTKTEILDECPISPLLFLEEPGKTKIVDCINVASTQTLSTLSCGQQIFFKQKKYSIDMRDAGGTYVGALPDDLSYKLLVYMRNGNEYSAHIKRIGKSCVTIFIRELSRGKKFKSQASFSGTTNYLPYAHDQADGKVPVEAQKPDTDEEE